MEKVLFGAGCFWGVEAAFLEVKGVQDAVSGYAGGTKPNPTYQEVCTGRTGHAEVVEVTFDPKTVSFQQLLEFFFMIHDPTQLNRQGPDTGTQYRTAIYTTTPSQLDDAQKYKESLEKSKKFQQSIVTEIKPAPEFYRAEEYHQRYFEKHPNMACHIVVPSPKG